MKLKPKKSNPPIPKFIYTLSLDVKPIHEQNSNPNLKTKSTEVIKTPNPVHSGWISGFFSTIPQISLPSCNIPPEQNPDPKKRKIQTRAQEDLPKKIQFRKKAT